MNDIENTDLGIEFENPAVELSNAAVDDSDRQEAEVVIGSLLFDRDGYIATSRRPRVRSSSIL
jgi:hypothetical protein